MARCRRRGGGALLRRTCRRAWPGASSWAWPSAFEAGDADELAAGERAGHLVGPLGPPGERQVLPFGHGGGEGLGMLGVAFEHQLPVDGGVCREQLADLEGHPLMLPAQWWPWAEAARRRRRGGRS